MIMKEHIGLVIKELRKQNKLTQGELSEKFKLEGWDVHQSYVSKIETNSKCHLTEEQYRLVLKILGLKTKSINKYLREYGIIKDDTTNTEINTEVINIVDSSIMTNAMYVLKCDEDSKKVMNQIKSLPKMTQKFIIEKMGELTNA